MKKVFACAMLAVLMLGIFGFITNIKADTTLTGTAARMRGIITKSGSTPVFGFLSARAFVFDENGTTHQIARVHAMWSTDITMNRTDDEADHEENATMPPLGNFSMSFYIAKLVGTTQVAFNTSSYDLDITGYWNVISITQTIEFDSEGEVVSCNRTWTPIVMNATGELGVVAPHFPTVGSFTLTIAGIDPLTGIVFRFGFRTLELEVETGDVNNDGKVDIHDLVKVAQGYGTMPGMPGYNEDLDFNFNVQIGIDDLATVAQSIHA